MRPMTQCERCAIRSYQQVENDCADAERRLAKADAELAAFRAEAAPIVNWFLPMDIDEFSRGARNALVPQKVLSHITGLALMCGGD
jgi:hypothetical protein